MGTVHDHILMKQPSLLVACGSKRWLVKPLTTYFPPSLVAWVMATKKLYNTHTSSSYTNLSQAGRHKHFWNMPWIGDFGSTFALKIRLSDRKWEPQVIYEPSGRVGFKRETRPMSYKTAKLLTGEIMDWYGLITWYADATHVMFPCFESMKPAATWICLFGKPSQQVSSVRPPL